MRYRLVLALVAVACATPAGTGLESPPSGTADIAFTARPIPAATPRGSDPTPGPVVLVGAGDIASCASDGARATAALLDAVPGTVFTAGDNAYEQGSMADFARCYAPTWGRHRARTRPALGSHDYVTPGAAAYFAYFGDLAGDPRTGYYGYDLGAWRILVLNSNCGAVGGCGPGSPQVRWLNAELAGHPARCALAIWHHPRWSSGVMHGSDRTYETFWSVLYERGVDVVINGHDHHYERFAPQTPDGLRYDAQGIREFVVGTGGASLRRAGRPIANSEVVRDDTFGVLKLTLRDGAYDWEFVPTAGSTFTDTGSGACH